MPPATPDLLTCPVCGHKPATVDAATADLEVVGGVYVERSLTCPDCGHQWTVNAGAYGAFISAADLAANIPVEYVPE